MNESECEVDSGHRVTQSFIEEVISPHSCDEELSYAAAAFSFHSLEQNPKVETVGVGFYM